MHESGLHYYDANGEQAVFVNTVSANKMNYSKKQIKGADRARALLTSLAYPSPEDY